MVFPFVVCYDIMLCFYGYLNSSLSKVYSVSISNNLKKFLEFNAHKCYASKGDN